MLDYRRSLYQLFFTLNYQTFLGISINAWIRGLLIILLVLSLFFGAYLLFFLLLSLLVIFESLVVACRSARYMLFSTQKKIEPRDTSRWLVEQAVLVTGICSDESLDRNILLGRGEVNLLPIGEIMITAEYNPHKYCYQFIEPEDIHSIEFGTLSIGPERFERTIKIDYKTVWSNKIDQTGIAYYIGQPLFKPVNQSIFLSPVN